MRVRGSTWSPEPPRLPSTTTVATGRTIHTKDLERRGPSRAQAMTETNDLAEEARTAFAAGTPVWTRLLVHALECSEQLRKLLREVWRIMAEGGRVLLVVPNRRGIWARLDHTPFGHGHPYTQRQVSLLLRDNLFQPEQSVSGLFFPPSRSRIALASAPAIEKIGTRWFPTFGGLLFLEAQKQIYAGSATGATQPAPRRSYIRVAGGRGRSERGAQPIDR